MPRQYVDTSLFRQPYYYNAYQGFGVDAPPPVPQGQVPANLTPDVIGTLVMQGSDGVYRWRADAKVAVDAALAASVVGGTFADNPDRIVLGRPTTPNLPANTQLATDWIKGKLSEGKSIITPLWLPLPPVPGIAQVEIAAVPASQVKTAASTPYAVLYASPGGMSMLKIGLIVGGAVVGVALIAHLARRKS